MGRVKMVCVVAALFAGCERGGGDRVVTAYSAAYQEADPLRAAGHLARVISPEFRCLDLDRESYLEAFQARSGSAYDAATRVDTNRAGSHLDLEIRRDVLVQAGESGFSLDARVVSVERRRLALDPDSRVTCDRTISRRVDVQVIGSAGDSVALPEFARLPDAILPGQTVTLGVTFPGRVGDIVTGIVHSDWAPSSFPSGWQDAEEQQVFTSSRDSALTRQVSLTFPGPVEPGQDTVTIAATSLVRPHGSVGAPTAFAMTAVDLLYAEENP